MQTVLLTDVCEEMLQQLACRISYVRVPFISTNLPSAAMSLILHFAISFNPCIRSWKHLEPNIATKFGRSPCVCSRTEELGWSHPLHPHLIPPPPNSLEHHLRRLTVSWAKKIKFFMFTNRQKKDKKTHKILKVPHTSRWQTVPLACQTIMTNKYCWTKCVNHWNIYLTLLGSPPIFAATPIKDGRELRNGWNSEIAKSRWWWWWWWWWWWAGRS